MHTGILISHQFQNQQVETKYWRDEYFTSVKSEPNEQ